jgi:hypothetical protein
MGGNKTLWVIPLLLSACTSASPVALNRQPLQPNNCGTPDKFKPCGRSHAVGAGQSKPKVVIEVLGGSPAVPATPASDDLLNYPTPRTGEAGALGTGGRTP